MDLAVLEADHHDHRHRYPATGGTDPGQHDVEHAIVSEGDVQFVDDLVLAHRSRDGLDLGVVGPLADEVVAVEVAHAGRAIATGDRWYVMDVGVVGHRRHRRLEVKVLELRLHVRVESRRQVAHSHSSNPPLRAVSLILSPSGGGRLVYRDTEPNWSSMRSPLAPGGWSGSAAGYARSGSSRIALRGTRSPPYVLH